MKTFEDLDAWKLSVELRDLVYEMTESGRAAKDFKFKDQIRDSSSSAPRNIAEGWARFYPNDNAQYLRWARASLAETQNHLLHGKTLRYFSVEDLDRAWTLSRRALGATTRLMHYELSCKGEVPGQPPRRGVRRPRVNKVEQQLAAPRSPASSSRSSKGHTAEGRKRRT